MKVLLINPPETYRKGALSVNVFFPLGLLYLGAMVRDICQIEIFDCLTIDFMAKKGNETYHGASPEIIKNVIANKKPDLVGVYVPSTTQYKNAELVAVLCKEVNPNLVVVFGGPDPSARFEAILKNDYCDYCVIGEGEQTFYELVKALSNNMSVDSIDGLAYRKDGLVHFKPRIFPINLDIFPYPAFDLLDMKKYLGSKFLYKNRSSISKNSISIVTSRGCPYACVFCSIRLHMGQEYRTHSPEYVINLIKLCKNEYGITNFHFEDDNLTLNKQRFEKILDLLIREDLKIHWDTPNGIRADNLNFEILKKMKQSGCVQITFAIESGSERVLNHVIKKNTSLKYILEIVKYCKDLEISTDSFYVIGLPGEAVEEMRNTISLAIEFYEKYDVLPHIMVATPLYGTELYDICIRDNLIKGKPTYEELAVATQTYGEPMISTRDFSREDVKKIVSEYQKKLAVARLHYLLDHPLELAGAPKRFLNKKLSRKRHI